MDYSQVYQNIYKLILPWKASWQYETLHHYPNTVNLFPQTWIEDFLNLTDQQQYLFDCQSDYSQINSSEFLSLLNKLKSVSHFRKSSLSENKLLDKNALKGMSPKKQHELKIICQKIDTICNETFDTVIDIGGGVGHLARTLAYYYNIPTISIDLNLAHQLSGKKKLVTLMPKHPVSEVTFENFEFGTKKKYFQKKSLLVGLHTCGGLANVIIDQSVEQKLPILSFGCCYHKIDLKNDKQINISKVAQAHNLEWTEDALTLAARGDYAETLESFVLKKRIKYFRFAIQLFLRAHTDIKTYIKMGSIQKELYMNEFSEFATIILEQLRNKGQIDNFFSKDELQTFYQNDDTQKQIKIFYAHATFRNLFSRQLEMLITLDRAMYLQENGMSVEINEYFDQNISPRNIGIYAY